MQFKDPTEKTTAEKTFYLAGKMSGIPQFNIPQFYKTAALLRESGYRIINPAEQDSDALRHRALMSLTGDLRDIHGVEGEETWGKIMGRDVEIVLDQVDGIIVFPNWTESNGARLEVFGAYILDKEILIVVEETGGTVVTELDPRLVREGLIG